MRDTIQDLLGNVFLLLGVWALAYRMQRRRWFPGRLALSLVVVCALRYLYFSLIKPNILAAYPLAYGRELLDTLGFSLLILVVVACAAFCFEGGFWPALFCGGASYCVQHIGQRLYRILARTWMKEAPEGLHVLIFIAIAAACLAAAWLLTRTLRVDKIVVDNKKLLLAVMAVVATAIVVDLLFFRALREGGELLQVCFTAYSVTVSALIFLLLLNMVSSKRIQLEADTLKEVLKSEQEQYHFEKSLIDTINIKVHDLKHQIALLEGQASRELADELRTAVSAYDSSFHTGNIALDVVLTRESFSCGEKNISMTCLADGKCLDFISEVDIYSLFGNILDNAIEAAEKVPDPEKRLLSLTIVQEGYFVHIRAENYFTDKLTFTNGLPDSTKSDSLYHGFGMKSIKMLVQKYGGSLKVYTKGERFVLDIMFSV